MRKIILIVFSFLLNIYAQENIVLKVYEDGIPVYATVNVLKPVDVDVHLFVGKYNDRLLSYGWILNADSREVVWKLSLDSLTKVPSLYETYEYSNKINLVPGRYYFIFIKKHWYDFYIKNFKDLGLIFDRLLKGKLGKREVDNYWKFTITFPEKNIKVLKNQSYFADKYCFICFPEIHNNEFKTVSFKILRKPKNEPVSFEIYAQGEGDKSEHVMYDYGWISNEDNVKIWEFNTENSVYGGGSKKNLKYRGNISLNKGVYKLVWISDDSHCINDWNKTPPYDPLFWGVTLKFKKLSDTNYVKLININKNIKDKLSLTKVRNNALVSKKFALTKPTLVHIIAIGEAGHFKDMVDYGWIIDNDTHKKVWEFTYDISFPAGGSIKNRRFEGDILLKPGSYTVYYVTDDSHAFRHWNAPPPANPDMYGITLYFIDSKPELSNNNIHYSKEKKEEDINYKENQVIVNFTPARNDELLQKKFVLNKITKIAISAIGEGDEDDMYDYGWIVDLKTGKIVWKMLYENTTWAGGARKNRLCKQELILEPGEYRAYYVTDDSHAFGSWNEKPPSVPEEYGMIIRIVKFLE